MKKAIVLLVLLAIALAAGHYWVRMDHYRGFAQPVFVDIPRGTSTLRIGDLLSEAGVIRHPLLFPLARLTHPSAKPQAGEYRFSESATPAEVFERIARGDVYTIEILVPEGSNVYDIAEIVERAGLGNADEFTRAALTYEGYLFPSTYHFRRSATTQTICRTMRSQFDKVWEDLGAPEEMKARAVTLASLVETEAVHEDERARIAGVYVNRLAKGMNLECDPTVAYAARLDGHWRGTIYRSDLESTNRYNTYRHSGLPPGPVANPGLASLKAALHPVKTNELYFVANPDHSGRHIFSVDYASHQKAVAAYRYGERKAVKENKSAAVAAKPKRTAR